MADKAQKLENLVPRPKNDAANDGLILDRHWHLSTTDDEIALTELEIALFRTFAAFDAWQQLSQVASADLPLNATDTMVLNIIRMKERPKVAAEVTRLLNRQLENPLLTPVREWLHEYLPGYQDPLPDRESLLQRRLHLSNNS